MYDGAESGQFELKVVLAVVVLLGLIRVGGALTEEEPAPEDVVPAETVLPESPPSTHASPLQEVTSAAGERDSTLLAAEADLPEAESEGMEETDPGTTEAEDAGASRALLLQAPQPPPDAVDPDTIDAAAIAVQLGSRVRFEEQVVAPPTPPPPRPPPAQPEVTREPDPVGEAELFEAVEQMPELIGGLPGLQRRIVYPEHAHNAGVEGRVFVQFIVDERGAPHDVRVVRGIGAGCDEAAVQAIRESRFAPGLQRGRPVRVRMTLPVTFRLDD